MPQALHFADLAGNADARVTALASMALQACTTGDPSTGREAVDLTDAAKRSASTVMTDRLASLLSARQAIGYARIGDAAAAEKAISAAARSLGTGTPTDDEPTWLHFWGPADLACHEARTYLAIGQTRRAEQAAAAAQAACDENAYPRNHTIYAAVRATALIQDKRVDEAIAAATPVVARASTFGSRRIVTETHNVVRLLGKYRDYGPAASFAGWATRLLPAA